jgi:hypothetical protein
LADVVELVFSEVPGIELRERSHVLLNGSAEVDLVFKNNPYVTSLPTQGVTLFVECKNEARPIKAAQVRDFSAKMRGRNQRLGVMVSRKGLSGRASTHGHAAVTDELAQGRSIIVLTLDDLEGLKTTDDLISLCIDRLGELEHQGTYLSV